MDEELQLFGEDAAEQLQFMENALLDATQNGIDDEKVGAIFRAMHTIKGTAGMFGFDTVVKFTHIAENLLDEVRKGSINITDEMLELFLSCKDHVEKLIELAVDEEELSEDMEDNNANLLERLLSFSTDGKIEDKPQINEESANQEYDLSQISSTKSDIWHVSIRFDEDFFTSGMDIISIFNFFNKMGEIVINIPIINKIPKLEELEPLKTAIGFELDFQTDVGHEEIEEIFEFVEDDVTLHIFKHDDLNGLKDLLEDHEDDYLEKIFVEEGVYSSDDIFDAFDPPVSSQVQSDQKEVDEPKKEIIEEKKEIKKSEPQSKEIPKEEKKKSAKKEKSPNQKHFSLRVDSVKVDQLINQMSEIVIANANISQIADDNNDTKLSEAVDTLKNLLEEVRDGIMNIRMVQVEDSFVKFKRIVNDTAKKIGKDIDFIISGGETELDKVVVEKISDPLVHMLRNSVDHGIELPQTRIDKGKNPKGRVDLRAYPDAGTIIIEIEDDGAGINKDKLLEKALSSGIVSPDDNLTDKEIYKLIFAAGLSTAEQVSDISGRGVGMDVVRRNIEELRGTIDVDSTLDKGSKITIRLPLTLAIIDGFLVQAGKTKYVIPLENIQECIELTDVYKDNMKGNQFINLRGEILPILDIREYFNEERSSGQRENIVIVRYANETIGLQVDELFGEYQTVIKPLGDIFENVPGISGGSILGSGEVSLIFDIPQLIESKIKNSKGENNV